MNWEQIKIAFDDSFKDDGNCYEYLYNCLDSLGGFPLRACIPDQSASLRRFGLLPFEGAKAGMRGKPYTVKQFLNYKWALFTPKTDKINRIRMGGCQTERLRPDFVRPRKYEKNFARCLNCDRDLSVIKGTFFENRKIKIINIFLAITMAEFYDFEKENLFDILRTNVYSNYEVFGVSGNEVSDKHLRFLINDIIDPENRGEFECYNLLNYVLEKRVHPISDARVE